MLMTRLVNVSAEKDHSDEVSDKIPEYLTENYCKLYSLYNLAKNMTELCTCPKIYGKKLIMMR